MSMIINNGCYSPDMPWNLQNIIERHKSQVYNLVVEHLAEEGAEETPWR